MRRLGAELGVEAMSLYNHVSGKSDVLDGIHEAILATMIPPRPRTDWRMAARDLSRSFRRVLRAHPNALPVFATRPAVAKGSLRHVESALALLRDAGFSPRDSISALQTLVTFVVGHALFQFGRIAGAEDAEPAYAALSTDEFPRVVEAARIMPRQGVDEEFEFGLDALVAGLELKRATGRRRR